VIALKSSIKKDGFDLRVDPFDTWCRRCLKERWRNRAIICRNEAAQILAHLSNGGCTCSLQRCVSGHLVVGSTDIS
jgi:hypothetical protein